MVLANHSLPCPNRNLPRIHLYSPRSQPDIVYEGDEEGKLDKKYDELLLSKEGNKEMDSCKRPKPLIRNETFTRPVFTISQM